MSDETIKRLRDAHAAWMKKHPEYDIIDAVNEAAARIATLESRVSSLLAENDKLSVETQRHIDERDHAVRTLMRAGWTLTEGAAGWKPPIGKRPDFERIDRLEADLADERLIRQNLDGVLSEVDKALDPPSGRTREAVIREMKVALDRKQRCIDEACDFYDHLTELGVADAGMAQILRPEATPTPAAVPSVAGVTPAVATQATTHHPDDPLKVEWTDEGFRIVEQPEEWRHSMDEMHGDVHVRCVAGPDWYGRWCLRLRGACENADNRIVGVPAADRPRVQAAIASVNAKHRPKGKSMMDPLTKLYDFYERSTSAVDQQPAPAEPSGDRAVRLVKRLAGCIRQRWLEAMSGGPIATDWKAELDAIIAECDKEAIR